MVGNPEPNPPEREVGKLRMMSYLSDVLRHPHMLNMGEWRFKPERS
jgi:hypothetical protein